MSSRRPGLDTPRYRYLNVADDAAEVLSPENERRLLHELAECKQKLGEALVTLRGVQANSAPSDPRALAEFIAASYVDSGPDQARLGAVYRKYCTVRDKLALANLKLVAHVAKRFRDRGVPLSDLMQDGFCGLLEAIDRFDLNHETKLATYATWWIRQSMQRSVASGAYPVRLTPRHLRQLAQNQEQQGDSASISPAHSSHGHGGGDLIDRIQTAVRPTISLDAALSRNSELTLIQTMSDPDGDRTTDVDDDETIEKMLETLRPREQQVLRLRFGLGGQERLSLTQVGKMLEVSKERVRQIEERALSKLRASVACPLSPN